MVAALLCFVMCTCNVGTASDCERLGCGWKLDVNVSSSIVHTRCNGDGVTILCYVNRLWLVGGLGWLASEWGEVTMQGSSTHLLDGATCLTCPSTALHINWHTTVYMYGDGSNMEDNL